MTIVEEWADRVHSGEKFLAYDGDEVVFSDEITVLEMLELIQALSTIVRAELAGNDDNEIEDLWR